MRRRSSTVPSAFDEVERSASSISSSLVRGRSQQRQQVMNVRVMDRRSNGVHVRFDTVDGHRRAVWIPQQLIGAVQSGGTWRSEVIQPTDGGPEVGSLAYELLRALMSGDALSYGSSSHAVADFAEVPTRIHAGASVPPTQEPRQLPAIAPMQRAFPSQAEVQPGRGVSSDTLIVAAIGAGTFVALVLVLAAAAVASFS